MRTTKVPNTLLTRLEIIVTLETVRSFILNLCGYVCKSDTSNLSRRQLIGLKLDRIYVSKRKTPPLQTDPCQPSYLFRQPVLMLPQLFHGLVEQA